LYVHLYPDPREELINSHHPLDEAYPKGTRPRYLFPTARGGARAKGPVRPLSSQILNQTNSRYVPDVSALSSEDPLEIDAETKDLLKSLGMDNIPVNVTNVTSFAPKEKKGRYVPGSGRN
jgi:hypothetical protein